MFRILNPSATPKPFGDSDVMHILEILNINAGNRIGRSKLAESVNLSEGYVRTILKRLEDMGFVDVSHRGITISGTGSGFLDTLGISLMEIDRTDSAIGTYQVALLLKGKADVIEKGVEQRDTALKSGGDGCTTIVCKNGKLILPPNWIVDERSPGLASQIRSHGTENGDVVLIGGSNTGIREAATAANSAALKLIG